MTEPTSKDVSFSAEQTSPSQPKPQKTAPVKPHPWPPFGIESSNSAELNGVTVRLSVDLDKNTAVTLHSSSDGATQTISADLAAENDVGNVSASTRRGNVVNSWEIDSQPVASAIHDAVKRAFKDGQLDANEAAQLNAAKRLLASAGADGKFTPQETKEIVRGFAAVTPQKGPEGRPR